MGRQKYCRSEQGFTLIEVMVVVVILGILAAVIVPKIMDRPDEARVVKAKNDIRVLQTQLALYAMDNLSYPTTDQGLEALIEKPSLPPSPPKWKLGGYIDRLPTDPWGRAYRYLSPGRYGDFDLYSLGADGREGGAGRDADITSWEIDS